MAAKQSQQVTKALRSFDKTNDVYASARKHKIAPTTLYRAIKRRDNPPIKAAAYILETRGAQPPSDTPRPKRTILDDVEIDREATELGLVRTAGESDESLGARIEQLKRLRSM